MLEPIFNSRAKSLDQRHQCLLDDIAQGSRQAFAELYDHFYSALIRFVYRYTQSAENIEEIVNDTMLVVWQKADTFQGKSRVSTWIMGIAMRRALKQVEKDSRWQALTARDEQITDWVSPDHIADFTVKQALDWAMSSLSPEHSTTIELSYYYGFTCEEIADIFDCPVSTTKTRLHYARKRLRETFSQCKEPMNFDALVGGRHENHER